MSDDSGFGFYVDANLTTKLGGSILSVQKDDGSTPPNQFQLWFGSPRPDFRVRANSNPGTDQIALSIVDDNVGSGHPATEVKLALISGGLASATGGASLNIGTEVLSGIAEAVEFWVEVDDTTGDVGFSNELYVTTNSVLPENTA